MDKREQLAATTEQIDRLTRLVGAPSELALGLLRSLSLSCAGLCLLVISLASGYAKEFPQLELFVSVLVAFSIPTWVALAFFYEGILLIGPPAYPAFSGTLSTVFQAILLLPAGICTLAAVAIYFYFLSALALIAFCFACVGSTAVLIAWQVVLVKDPSIKSILDRKTPVPPS